MEKQQHVYKYELFGPQTNDYKNSQQLPSIKEATNAARKFLEQSGALDPNNPADRIIRQQHSGTLCFFSSKQWGQEVLKVSSILNRAIDKTLDPKNQGSRFYSHTGSYLYSM